MIITASGYLVKPGKSNLWQPKCYTGPVSGQWALSLQAVVASGTERTLLPHVVAAYPLNFAHSPLYPFSTKGSCRNESVAGLCPISLLKV